MRFHGLVLAVAAVACSLLAGPSLAAELGAPLSGRAVAAYYSSADAAPPPRPSGRSLGTGNVEVVVNTALHDGGQINAGLNKYLRNIRRQGYNPILTTSSFADAAALRAHLAGRYANDGLAGAVFIGDLPVASYEIDAHGSWEYESFPCDLYYQDLDGLWVDVDANGVYDHHVGNEAPEIWLGRLLTHELTALHPGRTEAGMLNDYFARNDAYRGRQLGVADNGLAYVDDDWAAWSSRWSTDLSSAVAGTVTTVSAGATTTAADYTSRLQTEYEHVLLAAHSNVTKHAFKIGEDWTGGSVFNHELEGLDPQALFYNLFACLNARYTDSGYMAGEYVFGTDMGLLAVGSTKNGSMLSFGDYFEPLGQGEIFGDALLNWWLARAAGGFDSTERDWHYGMTMLGDPLLLTQEFIPEPTCLLLLAAAAAAVLKRRA